MPFKGAIYYINTTISHVNTWKNVLKHVIVKCPVNSEYAIKSGGSHLEIFRVFLPTDYAVVLIGGLVYFK